LGLLAQALKVKVKTPGHQENDWRGCLVEYPSGLVSSQAIKLMDEAKLNQAVERLGTNLQNLVSDCILRLFSKSRFCVFWARSSKYCLLP